MLCFTSHPYSCRAHLCVLDRETLSLYCTCHLLCSPHLHRVIAQHNTLGLCDSAVYQIIHHPTLY